MYILDLMNMRLAESIENTNIVETMRKFDRLCHANQIRPEQLYPTVIPGLYAVNVASECLRDGLGNRIWPKKLIMILLILLMIKLWEDTMIA